MNCLFPPELDDKQLLAYLDNPAADPVTAEHLEKCPYCRQKAKELDLFQNRLTRRLYRSTCPSPIELGQYSLQKEYEQRGDHDWRMLSAPQMLVIGQHLRECPLCTQELAELENFLPDDVDLVSKIKVVIARWIGGPAENSSSVPAFGALRGESQGAYTFEADGVVITLDAQLGANGQVSVSGQVAGDQQDQWTGVKVELRYDDKPPLSASLDDLGAYQFEGVSPAWIMLAIASPQGTEIQTPRIDLTV